MKQPFEIIIALAALLPIALSAPDLSARAVTCGAKGYDTNNEGYGYSHKGSYDGCSAACQKDSKKCKSFSFGNNECNLYNVQVAGNLAKDKNSPYVFYDASCIPTSQTTSSTTITKAATTTTASSSGKVSSTTTTSTSSSLSTVITTTSKTGGTSSTSRAATTSSNSPTPPCAAPTWVVSGFIFFNSSHNLDCAGSDFDNPLCYTGRDPQPEGYGPPDFVDAEISDIGHCHQQNPGTTPRRGVGDNVVRCSGSSYQFGFFGNSNSANSTGHFQIQNPFTCPDGSGWYASGSLDFELSCTYDSGKNATCTPASGTVLVPAQEVSCSYNCN